ncbi:MAG: hypothetical protein ACXU8S_15755 [Phenylobacterium sp.]
MKTAAILIAAAGALSLSLPAAAQPKAENSCFWTRDLRNHTVGGDHILYFDVGGRSVYRVDTSDSCLAGAASSDPIVLRDRPSTGQLCNKLDWDISVRGTHCIVSDVTRLTPAEAAALPRHVKP